VTLDAVRNRLSGGATGHSRRSRRRDAPPSTSPRRSVAVPFVGRIEPRIDAPAGSVQVLALWWEEDFGPRRAEGFVDAMREALGAYLRFARADRIEWPTELRSEKELFGTASLG
jgi:hypothetical protein